MIGGEPNKIEGLILNFARFQSLVRDLLLVKQYRVEVYVNQGTASNQNWVLEFKGSPGNLTQFEEILFGDTDVAVGGSIMALKLGMEGKSRLVGVSIVDTVATLISVCEFLDDETFSDLEALVVTNGPKECLVIQGDGSAEFQTIKQIMERSNVMITQRKKNEFSSDSIFQDLNSLIKFGKGQQENAQALPETNLKSAMSATAALIKYLDLTSDDGNMNQYSLKQLEQSRFIRLDAAAIKALNIEERTDSLPALVGDGPRSILGILNKCRTPQGRRLIAQWVRQPLKDLSLIKERHDIVEQLVNDSNLRSCLSDDHLQRIPDLQQLAKKLSRKKAGLQDCYKIYLCVSNLPVLLEILSSSSPTPVMRAMFVEPLTELISDMDKYQQMVEQTIDIEAAQKNDFMVRADFDTNLQDLKETIDELEEKMQGQISKVANDLDMEAGKTLKFESNQQYGYFFRITLKEEKILRNRKNYTIIDSNKSGVRFRNSKLTEINEEYLDARNKYMSQQKAVVSEIIEIAAGYSAPVKSIGSLIGNLDVLTAFAVAAVGATKQYVRPEMLPSENGEFNLVQARHPCLEAQNFRYKANDVAMKRDESHFYIITGPNMGGKSTYIRSAGVCALMAHIGSFVPCDSAKISLLDCILARVGADDSQTKGLSTFMTEMVEAAAILRMATKNSLVIIDELGRGTSTYEGCGIAWSIAEYLAKEVKAYCLFATHFHEITRLAEDVPAVKNRHVTANVTDDKLTLLYSVKPGICDQSFGIHVAKMAKFPESVVEFAKRKQAELEDHQNVVFEGSEVPEKKRKTIKEGEELITNFANKCKSLDKSLSESALKTEIQKLKDQILTHNNPYIKALLGVS
ncbi:DNA mismatch repair protein Msh2 isoform X2 [Venturia canescens]|nr:DNA mismatch repair protein Msh2 isoform X2 [Venturia canescens]